MDGERARRVRQKLAGARLRAMRSGLDLSVEECARALQLTPSGVTARELGLEPLLATELWRFAAACGLTPAAAYGGARVGRTPGERATRLQRKYLGAALAVAREAKGLTLEDAASGAGIEAQRLLLAEFGRLELTLAEAEALAALYELPPAELFPSAGATGTAAARPNRRHCRTTTSLRCWPGLTRSASCARRWP